MLAKLSGRLINRKANIGGGRLKKDAARHPYINRMEVVAILNLRDIRKAKPLHMRLHLCQLIIIMDSKGNMMNGSFSKGPASLRHIRLMQEIDDLLWPTLMGFKAHIGAILCRFSKAKSLHKACRFFRLTQAEQNTMDTAYGFILGDLGI